MPLSCHSLENKIYRWNYPVQPGLPDCTSSTSTSWQDGLINREADLIVVDEAHKLDDKVRSATTKRINQGMLLGLIKSATNEVKAADRQNIYGDVEDAKKSISVFFDRLKAQMQEQIDLSAARYEIRGSVFL